MTAAPANRPLSRASTRSTSDFIRPSLSSVLLPARARIAHDIRQRAARRVAAAQPARVGLPEAHHRGELLQRFAAIELRGVRRDLRDRLENVLADLLAHAR